MRTLVWNLRSWFQNPNQQVIPGTVA